MSAAVLALAALAVLAVVQPSGPRAAPDACVTIEDFSQAKLGAFPHQWKVRKNAGAQVYRVREDNGRRFLRAVSNGLGIQAEVVPGAGAWHEGRVNVLDDFKRRFDVSECRKIASRCGVTASPVRRHSLTKRSRRVRSRVDEIILS